MSEVLKCSDALENPVIDLEIVLESLPKGAQQAQLVISAITNINIIKRNLYNIHHGFVKSNEYIEPEESEEKAVID